jgi:hypothetical protein
MVAVSRVAIDLVGIVGLLLGAFAWVPLAMFEEF